jgi:hypothetical protein
MLFLIGLNWNIRSMIINLWYNADMKQWRWTLTDPTHFDMESGQRENLRDAMNDVANTVEYLLNKQT